MTDQLTEERQSQYYGLINELMNCPNGQEPDVLDAKPDLLDAGFVKTLVQVSMMMAHENNPDGAKFLIHVARELSIQLGLYPQSSSESNDELQNGA